MEDVVATSTTKNAILNAKTATERVKMCQVTRMNE